MMDVEIHIFALTLCNKFYKNVCDWIQLYIEFTLQSAYDIE